MRDPMEECVFLHVGVSSRTFCISIFEVVLLQEQPCLWWDLLVYRLPEFSSLPL